MTIIKIILHGPFLGELVHTQFVHAYTCIQATALLDIFQFRSGSTNYIYFIYSATINPKPNITNQKLNIKVCFSEGIFQNFQHTCKCLFIRKQMQALYSVATKVDWFSNTNNLKNTAKSETAVINLSKKINKQ